MVPKSASLVEGEDEKCIFPLSRAAKCFVDIFDEGLSHRYGGWWVEGVEAAAFRIDISELRQLSVFGVRKKLSNWFNIGCPFSGRCRPIVEERIWKEARRV